MSLPLRTAVHFGIGFVAAAAVGLAAGGILAVVHHPDQPTAESSGVVIGELGRPSFRIGGDVTDLVPGRTSTLRVEVSNPHSWPIRILTITVEAEKATTACHAARHLRMGSYDYRRPQARMVIVPAGGTTVVPLPIWLPNAPDRNQDACKNATFTLHYTGTAGRFAR